MSANQCKIKEREGEGERERVKPRKKGEVKTEKSE